MADSDDVSILKKLFWFIMLLVNAYAFANSLYFVISLINEVAIYSRSTIIAYTIAELLPRLAIIAKIFEYSKSDSVKPKIKSIILTLIGKEQGYFLTTETEKGRREIINWVSKYFELVQFFIILYLVIYLFDDPNNAQKSNAGFKIIKEEEESLILLALITAIRVIIIFFQVIRYLYNLCSE